MAHTSALDEKVLSSVAGEIGSFMRSLSLQAPLAATAEAVEAPAIAAFALAESFQLWKLSEGAIARSRGEKLKDIAEATDRWYHQLRTNDIATGFSVSLGKDPESVSTVAVFTSSPLAAAIDAAVKWIDEHVDNDPVVHVLKELKFQSHMLWLLDEETDRSQCIVLEGPLKRPEPHELEPYEEDELLDRLRALPAALGLLVRGQARAE